MEQETSTKIAGNSKKKKKAEPDINDLWMVCNANFLFVDSRTDQTFKTQTRRYGRRFAQDLQPGLNERERQRETETETDRHRDTERDTERQRQRDRDRQTQRDRDRQRHRETETVTDREAIDYQSDILWTKLTLYLL